jgi:hypothetical protein
MKAAAERFTAERDVYSMHLHYMDAAEWKNRLGEAGDGSRWDAFLHHRAMLGRVH